jgi:hypothetical protein
VRLRNTAAAVAAGALAVAAAPALARAAVPSGPHDPCVRAGRDTCGTTGVGFYRTYRYGLRWFGDYRGAVPGQLRTFCLDLGYWYASRAYRYRRTPAARLHNKDGAPVPAERRRRLAYAIWTFGRSTNPVRQAAVMLYVHSLMGDARPGEIDPAVAGPKAERLLRRIARTSSRYHGPYRIEARLAGSLTVGRRATAAIRVLSAHGRPLPDVGLALSATGASGLPRRTRTNAAGVARLELTPTAVAGLRIRVRTAPLASTEPHVFTPTAGASRTNGQRLAAPASQRVTSTVARTHVVAAPQLAARASTQTATVSETVTSTVTVSGLGGSHVPVRVRLWGPYSRRDQISCSGSPYSSSSVVAAGDTTITTRPVEIDTAGYYAYQASVAAQPTSLPAATACAESTLTLVAVARPSLATAVSEGVVRPGGAVSDVVRVRGLGRTTARIDVELYGPFASRAAIRCTAQMLAWKGQLSVAGDRTVRTPPARLARAGFYGYRERVAATKLVAATVTPCAPAAETALAVPEIVTGKGDVAAYTAGRGAGSKRPVRIRLGAAGIDAPVAASAIDVAHGVLGIPADIHRTGWWRDGAAPGAAAGTILVAGHVDSARGGIGALFRLHLARVGDRVELDTASGHAFAYRIVSVRSYRKDALPTAVYSDTGRARLVIVTCGGPFDAVSGHYRDDVVVTAVPVS